MSETPNLARFRLFYAVINRSGQNFDAFRHILDFRVYFGSISEFSMFVISTRKHSEQRLNAAKTNKTTYKPSKNDLRGLLPSKLQFFVPGSHGVPEIS